MKKFSMALALMAAMVMIAGTAMAVPFGDGGALLQKVLDAPSDYDWDGSGTIEPSELLSIGILSAGPNYPSSSVNVATDEIPDASDSYWNITGTGVSAATLIIELASFASSNIFGIYDAQNTNLKVPVFSGVHNEGDFATVSIKFDGSVWVVVQDLQGGTISGGDSGIDFGSGTFGYYLDSSSSANGGVWHSDSLLNADGQTDHLAVYQGTNDDTVLLPGNIAPGGLWTDQEYVLAWEDLTATVSDFDYTDMVLMVESVNPVPEPSTLFFLGFGLIGLAGIMRKKFKI